MNEDRYRDITEPAPRQTATARVRVDILLHAGIYDHSLKQAQDIFLTKRAGCKGE